MSPRSPSSSDDVRIVVDPGPPATTVDRVRDRLAERLSTSLGVDSVTVDTEMLALGPDGALLVPELVERTHRNSSAAVVVTEFPRLRGRHQVMVEIDHDACTALVSLPALGVAPDRRLIRVIEDAIRRLRDRDAAPTVHGARWFAVDGGEYLATRSALGRTRMVLGMVRGNRPWRLIPTLTGVMAAAAATASFGVFYSSIWAMANALSPWRLAGLSVLSVTVMTVWLIANNRLWERRDALPRYRARLYNAATTVTIVLNAIVLYLGLLVVTLCGALAVIDDGYLASQVGSHTGLRGYVFLAWLATSMGTVAGAVGSSADSYDDILEATYGHRERARRQRE
ncbi:MAG: hypothetical protein INR72_05475 [Williamsia herbipolensis]|uniref:Uncharacterized protein n=1 Tax=Williamsia serinedens TaxID=391736 RepID=A0ABT1GYA8_9NOCA|nr:hypothetical protein [Williamsia herbipolensis]MCP2159974.1 hypothetical protein [Williamsia serinedens]